MAQLSNVDAILFDFSGTLVDDLPMTWTAFNKFFELCGLSSLEFETFREKFCLPCSSFLIRMGVPEKAVHEFPTIFNQLYLESLSYVRLFPEVEECLTVLKQNGLKLGVVSAIPSELLGLTLEKLKLGGYFRVVLGDAQKPSPLSLQQACKIIGTNPKYTIYVGDMEVDVLCAKRAGATPVGICRKNGSYQDKAKLVAQKPRYIVSDLWELLDLL